MRSLRPNVASRYLKKKIDKYLDENEVTDGTVICKIKIPQLDIQQCGSGHPRSNWAKRCQLKHHAKRTSTRVTICISRKNTNGHWDTSYLPWPRQEFKRRSEPDDVTNQESKTLKVSNLTLKIKACSLSSSQQDGSECITFTQRNLQVYWVKRAKYLQKNQ